MLFNNSTGKGQASDLKGESVKVRLRCTLFLNPHPHPRIDGPGNRDKKTKNKT
jgi:hypothetical protein